MDYRRYLQLSGHFPSHWNLAPVELIKQTNECDELVNCLQRISKEECHRFVTFSQNADALTHDEQNAIAQVVQNCDREIAVLQSQLTEELIQQLHYLGRLDSSFYFGFTNAQGLLYAQCRMQLKLHHTSEATRSISEVLRLSSDLGRYSSDPCFFSSMLTGVALASCLIHQYLDTRPSGLESLSPAFEILTSLIRNPYGYVSANLSSLVREILVALSEVDTETTPIEQARSLLKTKLPGFLYSLTNPSVVLSDGGFDDVRRTNNNIASALSFHSQPFNILTTAQIISTLCRNYENVFCDPVFSVQEQSSSTSWPEWLRLTQFNSRSLSSDEIQHVYNLIASESNPLGNLLAKDFDAMAVVLLKAQLLKPWQLRNSIIGILIVMGDYGFKLKHRRMALSVNELQESGFLNVAPIDPLTGNLFAFTPDRKYVCGESVSSLSKWMLVPTSAPQVSFRLHQ